MQDERNADAACGSGEEQCAAGRWLPARAAVVGAGVMGTGIAQVLASAGIEVTLIDVNEQALSRACALLETRLGRLSRAPEVRGSLRIEDARDAEAVVEAVFEDLDVKRATFAELGRVASSGALLATNTSSLSVSAIAEAAAHPERVVGMHFMNPPAVMRLVEVVRGKASSEESVARAAALARSVGKTPVVVADRPGFVVNRLLIPLINEAARELEEGVASAESIDTAMKLGANFPMGPLHLADLIGIDVVVQELRELERELGAFYRAASPLLERLARGELGRKTGKGFFTYERG